MSLVLLRSVAAAAAGYIGALFWTRTVTHLSRRHLPPPLARKLSHVTTAPFFLFTWPLYPPTLFSPPLAALVPLSFALRLLRNPSADPLVLATSRSPTPQNNPREARSLAAYGISIAALTALGWRNSPATYIAVAALCAGDAAADLVGTALRGPRLPLPRRLFPNRKTLPGTLAFLVFGQLGAHALLHLAVQARFLTHTPGRGLVAAAVAVAAAAEVLPVEDNITVPLAAYVAAKVLLHGSGGGGGGGGDGP